GLKVYETREDIKNFARRFGILDFIDEVKNWKPAEAALAKKEEIDAGIREVLNKHKKISLDWFQRFTENRFAKAFPNMKFLGREEAFSDLKQRITDIKNRNKGEK
ncbi:MAG: hypothetical protein K6B75_01195, partial [Lachnospiraceae bacterium]|nr:hypothetical protein [Lachnospiraceae bacterium]